MKKQIVKSIVVASFLVLIGSVLGHAQVHGRVIANIPFDFFVKSQKFPAGEYEIMSVNPTAGQTALSFKKTDGTPDGAIVTLLPMNIERQKQDRHRF